MRVLLVQVRPGRGVGLKAIAAPEPLGLEMIGAALGGHEVRLVDLMGGIGDLDKALRQFEPEAVGISCGFTVDVYQTQRVAARVKASKSRPFVFIGGHHASLSPADFRESAVDAIVVGEGEVTAARLVQALQSGDSLEGVSGLILNRDGVQVSTGPRALVNDLDTLPFPARSLSESYRRRYYLGFNRPLSSVETARGCPYRCSFCSVWRFYEGKTRTKSPERAVAEIEATTGQDVLVTDDNFLLDVNRAAEIARLLEARGVKRRYYIQARSDAIVRYPDLILQWKRLGLRGIFIGVEKTDEQGLNEVNKHNTVENNEAALEFCRQHGIGVTASFIVDPDFTAADFARLRDYIKRWNIGTPSFTVLTPLPGTDLFAQFKDKLTTTNYELFDLLHAVVPTRLSLRDFYREFAYLYASSYTSSPMRWLSLVDLIKSIVTGRVSLQHLRRLTSMLTEFTDPNRYLADHQLERDRLEKALL